MLSVALQEYYYHQTLYVQTHVMHVLADGDNCIFLHQLE